jgi:hypothetical protein
MQLFLKKLVILIYENITGYKRYFKPAQAQVIS